MLISIPMAVYNGQDFLDRSIGSLIKQTSENWELICVDDGSTDRSAEIIKEYAKKDERISLIRQSNKGHPTARMMAYRAARGDYVFTGVDQDDYVAPDFVARLAEDARISKAEIVLCNWLLEQTDGSFLSFFHKHGRSVGDRITGRQAFVSTFPWTIHLVGLWNRRLVETYAVQADYAYNNYDADEYLARRIALDARDVFLGGANYFHCRNLGSVTSRPSARRLQALDTNSRLLALAREHGCPPDVIGRILLEQRNRLANAFHLVPQIVAGGDDSRTAKDMIAYVDRYLEELRRELSRHESTHEIQVGNTAAIRAKLEVRYWRMRIATLLAQVF